MSIQQQESNELHQQYLLTKDRYLGWLFHVKGVATSSIELRLSYVSEYLKEHGLQLDSKIEGL